MATTWKTVGENKKPRSLLRKVVLPTEHMEVEREIWNNEFSEDERNIFNELRKCFPKTTTAEILAETLGLTKQEVGDYLYDGEINGYIERFGERHERKYWRIKPKI